MFKQNENKIKYEHIMLNVLEKTVKSHQLCVKCSKTTIMFKPYEHDCKLWRMLVRTKKKA